MNLQIADPAMPAPGEMVYDHHHSSTATSPYPGGGGGMAASPRLLPMASLGSGGGDLNHNPHHHRRTTSLGELHQELENEQEYQVNRLLTEIRRLQEQLQQQQQLNGQQQSQASQGDQQAAQPTDRPAAAPVPIPAAAPVAAPPPPGFPPGHINTNINATTAAGSSLPRGSPIMFAHSPRGSMDATIRQPLTVDARRRSRTPSGGALAISPRLRSGSVSFGGGEAEQQLWDVVKGRDENAFYQAETQMLTRENQMLRHRIRELGKFPPHSFSTPILPAVRWASGSCSSLG